MMAIMDAMHPSSATQVQDLLVRRILQSSCPERIILFGSRARGDAGPDADFDVLVVLAAVDDRRREAVRLRALMTDCPYGIDIVVTTLADLAWKVGHPGTLEWAAAHDGTVLYDRSAA